MVDCDDSSHVTPEGRDRMDDPQVSVTPDGPRTDLDEALTTLMASARKVSDTQERLRGLVRANQTVVQKLDLPAVLTALVTAGLDLVGARYGALGVMSPEGGLEQFVHVGMPDELVARIGHLPEGHGLLGAVLADGAAVRTDHLADDPRSSGFPAGHPAMSTFVGVPIRVRGQLFGSLYFAEKDESACGFTDEDEQLLTSLAATAGIAIDNARLFESKRRLQAWTAASTEIATALLSDDARSPLHLVADKVVALADADLVCIVLPATSSTVIVDTARGRLAGDLEGLVLPAAETLSGRALRAHEIVVAAEMRSPAEPNGEPLDLGPSIAVPLESGAAAHGALTVSRAPGSARFTDAEVTMIGDFSRQATLAIDIAGIRLERHHAERREDRNRIARDLHDHVIQRLFASGLELQATVRSTEDAATRDRLERQIDTLDAAITEIRAAIFALSPPRREGRASLRTRVIDLLTELGHMFDTTPRLAFSGALDLTVVDELCEDVLAVVREGLSNVARHAGATHVAVTVAVADDRAEVRITDDGVGIRPDRRESGLANLAARAAAWQGEMRVDVRDGGGTTLTWSAHLTRNPPPRSTP